MPCQFAALQTLSACIAAVEEGASHTAIDALSEETLAAIDVERDQLKAAVLGTTPALDQAA